MPARRKLSEHGIRNSDFIVTTENYSETRLEINHIAVYRTLLALIQGWRQDSLPNGCMCFAQAEASAANNSSYIWLASSH